MATDQYGRSIKQWIKSKIKLDRLIQKKIKDANRNLKKLNRK